MNQYAPSTKKYSFRYYSSEPTVYTAKQWVELLLTRALEKRASDIHFESHKEGWTNICLRVDGIIQSLDMPYITFVPQCIAHLKVLAGLDLHAKKLRSRGSIPISLRTYLTPSYISYKYYSNGLWEKNISQVCRGFASKYI